MCDVRGYVCNLGDVFSGNVSAAKLGVSFGFENEFLVVVSLDSSAVCACTPPCNDGGDLMELRLWDVVGRFDELQRAILDPDEDSGDTAYENVSDPVREECAAES